MATVAISIARARRDSRGGRAQCHPSSSSPRGPRQIASGVGALRDAPAQDGYAAIAARYRSRRHPPAAPPPTRCSRWSRPGSCARSVVGGSDAADRARAGQAVVACRLYGRPTIERAGRACPFSTHPSAQEGGAAPSSKIFEGHDRRTGGVGGVDLDRVTRATPLRLDAERTWCSPEPRRSRYGR